MNAATAGTLDMLDSLVTAYRLARTRNPADLDTRAAHVANVYATQLDRSALAGLLAVAVDQLAASNYPNHEAHEAGR